MDTEYSKIINETSVTKLKYIIKHNDPQAIWKNAEDSILKILFSKNLDPFLDTKHSKKYCLTSVTHYYDDNGLSKVKPVSVNDQWTVTCYCGSQMYLQRLKSDHCITKTCHCGSPFDILTYNVGTLLWLCTECPLTHEAHQQDNTYGGLVVKKGQPTGIPCSAECKNLRLTIHQMLHVYQSKTKCTRDDTYAHLSDLLQIPRDETHMALFDINTCKKAISLLLI